MNENIKQGRTHALGGMTLWSADSHFRIADSFLQSMPYDTSKIIQHIGENAGPLFAAVANLSLSIELYLKALLIRHDVKFEPVHDLKYLFDLLPNRIKTLIKTQYKAYKPYPDNPFDKLSAVDMLHANNRVKAKKHNLEAVLTRTKDSFVAYRYIFETIEKSSTKSLKFEYGALWCVARALRKQMSGSISSEGNTMVFESPFLRKKHTSTLRTAISRKLRDQ